MEFIFCIFVGDDIIKYNKRTIFDIYLIVYLIANNPLFVITLFEIKSLLYKLTK